jgi:hypothetical protein
MSDHSISIVASVSHYAHPQEKAAEIIAWLIERDVIKNERTACIIGEEGGYKMSAGARLVVCNPADLRYDLAINGLEVVTEKEVFHTGEYGLESAKCPYCSYSIEAKNMYSMINDWFTSDTDHFSCPGCHVQVNLQDWQCDPVWGFSNLGFTFWNWPIFTTDFLEQFAQKMKAPIKVVHQHL